MFAVSLRQSEHTREYSIASLGRLGWEVRVEEDRQPTRVARYSDWHRVERALARFRREVSDLTAHGWQQIPS